MATRFCILLSVLFGFAAMAQAEAAECNLWPDDRPAGLAAYHALAETCLAHPPGPAGFDPSAESRFLSLLNGERKRVGLAELQMREALRAPARFHSFDQVWNGIFGHEGAGGRKLGERISALDRRLIYRSSRENVAMVGGDFDPAAVPQMLHNGLMNSPGHRANILATDITHVAIGVARVQDRYVVTQVFADPEGEFAAPLPITIRFDQLTQAAFTLDRWLARHLALEGADGHRVEAPQQVVGPHRVLVRGETAPSNSGYRFIYLPGPAVAIDPLAK